MLKFSFALVCLVPVAVFAAGPLVLSDHAGIELHLSGKQAVLKVRGQPDAAYVVADSTSALSKSFELKSADPKSKRSVLSFNHQRNGTYVCMQCADLPVTLAPVPKR